MRCSVSRTRYLKMEPAINAGNLKAGAISLAAGAPAICCYQRFCRRRRLKTFSVHGSALLHGNRFRPHQGPAEQSSTEARTSSRSRVGRTSRIVVLSQVCVHGLMASSLLCSFLHEREAGCYCLKRITEDAVNWCG